MGTSASPTDPHPSSAALLELEARARRQGSGIQDNTLLGVWRLDQVWPRSGGPPSAAASAVLRSLGARLQIERAGGQLNLSNAVQAGALTLHFVGSAELTGQRPLLRFCFNELRLSWGQRRLWTRALPVPATRQMPFFALIARSDDGWLAARGRGGGLALWRLEP